MTMPLDRRFEICHARKVMARCVTWALGGALVASAKTPSELLGTSSFSSCVSDASDSATCKHRFYGDEWNVTVLPLRPMETQLTVQRVDDPESGWAYDGLRVEYTVCGQDKTGAVTQGQGLWRPSVGKKQPFSSLVGQ